MKAIKTWWLTKGWPWLKENWWATLLLPVMALVAGGMAVLKKRPVVVDVMENADAKALEESNLRIKALEEERTALQGRLGQIQAKYEALQADFEARLIQEVDDMRKDPNRLRDAMIRAGRGE